MLNGRPLLTETITQDPCLVRLTVPAGARPAHLTLQILEGADAPAALGQGLDPRPLTIGVADLQAEDEDHLADARQCALAGVRSRPWFGRGGR